MSDYEMPKFLILNPFRAFVLPVEILEACDPCHWKDELEEYEQAYDYGKTPSVFILYEKMPPNVKVFVSWLANNHYKRQVEIQGSPKFSHSWVCSVHYVASRKPEIARTMANYLAEQQANLKSQRPANKQGYIPFEGAE